MLSTSTRNGSKNKDAEDKKGGCDGCRSVVVRTYLYVGWKKAVGYGKQRNVGDILLMF
jgi:hypothetical protein